MEPQNPALVPGAGLAPSSTEHHVFRAVLALIVLTLAVGQDAMLLCVAGCDPQSAAASGCHHEDAIDSPGVAGGRTCDDVPGVGAFVREEATRTVVAPHAQPAITVRCSPNAQLTVARPEWATGREWSLATRPLSTVLRL